MSRLVLVVVLLTTPLMMGRAQSGEPDIPRLIEMVDRGEVDQVRADLPSLLSRYPNNPGVLYLQGLVSEEGTEAVRIYQSIVDNFPRSEWADDALYRVYQFYYALGLYRTAELKLSQLRTEYPDSPFVTATTATETAALDEERPVPEPPDSTALAEISPSAPPVTLEAEQYFLQVGAFTVQANAERQKTVFAEWNYPVEIISKTKIRKSHGVESIVIAR